MLQSITLADRATVVLVGVDDGYQAHGACGRPGRPGAPPAFRHSEVMTVLRLMDFVPFAGETQCRDFRRAHHRALFPRRLRQSPFHRRARGVADLVAWRRRDGIRPLGATAASRYLRDTKPRPVVGYKRSQRHSDFVATADYGVCARRHRKCFGYQRVLLCTLEGVPVRYEWVPASTPEQRAAEEVRDQVWHAAIIADQGFLGADGPQGYRETRHLAILTPVRSNPHPVRSPGATGSAHGSRVPATSGRTPGGIGRVSCAKLARAW